MYKEYFGLKENPFSIAPDPHYFYMSDGHREALAHLIYGMGADSGFILLTGEVGTGKTMVCRCLLEQAPDNADIAFILNPKVTSVELLASICDEFSILYPEGTNSNKVLVSEIYTYLLQTHEKGRRAILIIEEAQNLTPDVLEQIRLLTNLETNKKKLLQIIMLGQPELLDLLSRPELRQLSQRITARYHLGPLSRTEVGQYVEHRLRVAGWRRGRLFPDDTLYLLFRLSGGIPRLINAICDRALVGAFIQNRDEVDKKTLATAAAEVVGNGRSLSRKKLVYAGAAALSLVLLVFAMLMWRANISSSPVLPRAQKKDTPQTQVTVSNIKSEMKPAGQVLAKPSPNEKTITARHAYETLFRLWSLPFDPSRQQSIARQAAREGLSAIESKGNLMDLRTMNKPAVLKLLDEKTNKHFYVTLMSLNDNHAEIAEGLIINTYAIQEIFLIWSGDFTLLWRPPAEYSQKLRIGRSGRMVIWLDRHLSIIQKRPMTGKRIYDEQLSNEVKKFQSSVGLTPDGVVGPMTVAYLQGLVDNTPPVLESRKVNR